MRQVEDMLRLDWLNKRLMLMVLLLAVMVRGVVYSIVVPLWEFPDEQAHFAQVAYMGDVSWSVPNTANLSREIYESEVVMGTLRDGNGVNKITYNPGYRHDFSRGRYGPFEKYLINLPPETRTEMVKREAALYPPLFYGLSLVGYSLFDNSSLFDRVLAVRAVSWLFMVGSVYFAYLIGKEMFGRKVWGIVLGILIGFQPMFAFVGAGVNNDNLLNLFGLLVLLVMIRIVKYGLTAGRSLLLGLVCGLAVLTKPLALPLVIAATCFLLWEWMINRRSVREELVLLLPLVIAGSVGGGWVFLKQWLVTGTLPYWPGQVEGVSVISFGEYIGPQLGRYYRETLVWYWGIFKWLGVILPLNVIRVIKVVMIAAGVGLVKLFLFEKNSGYKRYALLMIVVSFGFAVSLTVWDFFMVKSIGFSHGLQGRYFFPTLGAHMSLLLIGLISLVPKKLRLSVGKLYALAMVGLHSLSLKVLVENYYNTSDRWLMVMEMSQYKAEALKYPYMLGWVGVYFALIAFVLVLVLRMSLGSTRR